MADEVDLQTAHELVEMAKTHVTLDEFMRRHPKTLTKEDYELFIAAQRKARAMFDPKKRKDKV